MVKLYTSHIAAIINHRYSPGTELQPLLPAPAQDSTRNKCQRWPWGACAGPHSPDPISFMGPSGGFITTAAIPQPPVSGQELLWQGRCVGCPSKGELPNPQMSKAHALVTGGQETPLKQHKADQKIFPGTGGGGQQDCPVQPTGLTPEIELAL